MISRCSRCDVLTPVTEPGPLCFRCRPPTAAELAATWLPENCSLQLSAFDVGILLGALSQTLKYPGVTPAGVMYLLARLDRLAATFYPDDETKDAGGSSEPGGGR